MHPAWHPDTYPSPQSFTPMIHQAECIEYMAGCPDACFDAIIADPPYRTTNLAFDQAAPLDWAAWWAEAWRVVKPTGVVVLFAADLFTVDLILTQRANYRYRLVWEKSNNTGFLDASNRPMRSHEDVLLFARQFKASTYNVQKQPANRFTSGTTTAGLIKGKTHWGEGKGRVKWEDDGTRHPGSVLRFGSIKRADSLHPTQKPLNLMRWLVRSYTNPGETVLDCFAGSGSTGHACLLEGRRFVGTELNTEYCQTARARLAAVVATPSLFAQVE